MSEFKKITATDAQEVCREFGLALAAEAEAFAGGKAKPIEFFDHLAGAGRTDDAIQFLAYCLPKREAAWWACLAAQAVLPDQPPPADLAALAAAEAWVYKPTEDNRRKAMELAEAADKVAPSYWAALAVAWSGGSLAPKDLPEVPPANPLCGKAVVAAVTLATLGGEPVKAVERHRLFLAQGLDLAKGGNGRIDAAGKRLPGGAAD